MFLQSVWEIYTSQNAGKMLATAGDFWLCVCARHATTLFGWSDSKSSYWVRFWEPVQTPDSRWKRELPAPTLGHMVHWRRPCFSEPFSIWPLWSSWRNKVCCKLFFPRWFCFQIVLSTDIRPNVCSKGVTRLLDKWVLIIDRLCVDAFIGKTKQWIERVNDCADRLLTGWQTRWVIVVVQGPVHYQSGRGQSWSRSVDVFQTFQKRWIWHKAAQSMMYYFVRIVDFLLTSHCSL